MSQWWRSQVTYSRRGGPVVSRTWVLDLGAWGAAEPELAKAFARRMTGCIVAWLRDQGYEAEGIARGSRRRPPGTLADLPEHLRRAAEAAGPPVPLHARGRR